MEITLEFKRELGTLADKGFIDYNDATDKFVILKTTPKNIKENLIDFNNTWKESHIEEEDYFEFE